jgi:hypothetical protein
VERQVLAWFPTEEPALFGLDRCPVFIRQKGEVGWHGFPSLDGKTVKAAVHHHGQTVDPDGIDREVHPEDTAAIARLVGKRRIRSTPSSRSGSGNDSSEGLSPPSRARGTSGRRRRRWKL